MNYIPLGLARMCWLDTQHLWALPETEKPIIAVKEQAELSPSLAWQLQACCHVSPVGGLCLGLFEVLENKETPNGHGLHLARTIILLDQNDHGVVCRKGYPKEHGRLHQSV